MVRTLSSEFKEASNGMINPALYQKKHFNFFCGQYHKGIKCLDRCHKTTHDPQTREMMGHFFRSIKYLCVDHRKDFLKNVKCYDDTFASVTKTCDAKCGNMSKLDKLENGQEKAEQEVRLVVMKQKLDETCLFIDCHVSCSSPIMDKSCQNEEPAEFFEDFIASVFSDSAAEFKKLDLAHYWPKNCYDIGQGKFTVSELEEKKLEKFEEDVENAMVAGIDDIFNSAMNGDEKSSSASRGFGVNRHASVAFAVAGALSVAYLRN